MKQRFFELYNQIADSAKKEVIIHGLGCNNDVFREIKKSVNGLMKLPGFKNTSGVSFNSHKVLVEPLFKCKLYGQNNTARLLFKGYFLKKTELVKIVSEQLKERGYNITIPDFENENLIIDFLQNEDVFFAENKIYFFRPNGNKIEGVNEEEASLIAILLGWSATDPNEEKIEYVENITENINDINKAENGANTEINECDKVCTKNDFELRLNQLHQDFLKTSSLLLEIVEALNNGKIPEEYRHIDLIQALENRFNELKVEIKIHESLKITSIQELRDTYQEIERENNFLTELIKKALSTLITYKTIYHVTGKSFPFFQELDLLAESYKKEINEQDTAFNKDWFIKLTEEVHFFNYFIKAVRHRLLDNYDREELDEILDKLEKESERHGFSFFNKLSNQINRGDLNFKTEDTPTPPNPPDNKGKENLKPSEIKEESKIDQTAEEFNDVVIEEKPENISSEEKINEFNPDESVDIENKVDNEFHDVEAKLTTIEPEHVVEQAKEIENKEDDLIAIPVLQTETVSKLEKQKKLTISKEDSDILKLLELDEPELAYHLALCYENENKKLYLPSYLLDNLFLSQKIRTATGPIAEKITSNLKDYDIEFEKSDFGQLKNHLVFATLLRPSLIAFDTTGAGFLLSEMYSGKMSEFSEIKRLVYDYMSQNGGILNFELLGQISGEAALKDKKDNFKRRLLSWLERVQSIKYKNMPGHPYSKAYHNWVKDDGWLNIKVKTFLTNENFKILTELLSDDLEESNWQKKFDKELKLYVERNKQLYGNNEAFRWINKQIDDFIELISEGLGYFKELDSDTESIHSLRLELLEFVDRLKSEFKKLENIINNEKKDSSFAKISKMYISRSLENVIGILKLEELFDETLNIKEITNSALLKISFYDSDIDGSPLTHDNQLAVNILQYAEEPVRTMNEIAARHIESGNYESYYRMESIYGVKLDHQQYDKNERDFIHELESLIKRIKTEIERGCAYGYVFNGNRLHLISSVEDIAISIQDYPLQINFPLWEMKLNLLFQSIEKEKTRLAKENESIIPNGLDESTHIKLYSYLEKGNFLVFNESIERLKDGQLEFPEDKKETFKDFYHNFLKTENKEIIGNVTKSIREKSDYKGLKYSLLTDFQIKESIDLINHWYSIKTNESFNNTESFKSLNLILDLLGFKTANIEKPGFKGKSIFFDFKCTAISGQNKTPIPQFGSVAQGNYRLIPIQESLGAEDLINEIEKLSPENSNRIPVVIYLNWMNQSNRLELSNLSKNRRRIFLLIDEAMLIYLSGIKESKIPVLIQLAGPITYAEPYETGSSNLPEEMFYGRRKQILQLKNITGDYSCLIYGGRQLGKTVLQREVKRIFDDPDKNHFAIYVDLRIGFWNKIEQISTVLYDSLKTIPNIFPEREPSNFKIQYVVQKLDEWFKENQERRIILFLDEADEFLKQDSSKEFQHILPLKGLMEKTGKRFKIIFSGLHDVRRTIKIPNNPLAHFGTPICVGAMLDKEEAIEAQNLIRKPLQTLGYEFESDDLILMILSHCNWYPSLIQIFCSSLLNILNDKRNVKTLPVIITQNEITAAYEKSKNQIREKFHLTLELDERYDLLSNIVAHSTSQNPTIQKEGMSVNEITENAIFFWPDGFNISNPKYSVNTLLEEMVDLGILRMENEKFAMRTPNLLNLFGSEHEIQDNLYSKERTLPLEFNREVSRILYIKEKIEQRSPISAKDFDSILDPENNVVIFRGSKIGGLNQLEEFLLYKNKEINLIIPEWSNHPDLKDEEFWKFVEKKRVQEKTNIIFVTDEYPYTVNDIQYVNEKIGKKEFLVAVFLMNAKMYWNILSMNDKSFEKLLNQRIKIINLPLWNDKITKEWFRETACSSAEISVISKAIGNWHSLLDQYHSNVVQKPELWKETLMEFEQSILIEKEKILYDLGIIDKDLIDILNELIVMEGEISSQEFILDKKTKENLLAGENYLDYLSSLNLIDNRLRVEPFIKKLITNE